ncbi:MAG: glycosyltransferase [Rhodothermaceae bacterium]
MSKNIVHLITPYLFHTGSWVYSQLKGSSGFTHSVFTQRTENLDQFPLNNVYSVEDENKLNRFLNYLNRRLTHNYGMFFDKYVKEIKPFLFHGHMGNEAVHWLKFVKKHNIPLVATFYGVDVSKLGQEETWRKKYQELFEYGSYFLAEGPNLREQLIKLGCPEAKAVVQPLGIKVEKYPEKKYNRSDKTIILQTSTFREKKGIEYSLEALSKLKKADYNFEFRLIGAGDSEAANQRMENIAKEFGISENVKFLGKQPHSVTIEEMTKCDIFLHPSVQAKDGDNEGGAPVGLIEACATGCPVVSTTHADIPGVVVNNETGFLVEERNSDQIFEKLKWFIDNPEQMEIFGRRSRDFVQNKFDLKKTIPSLETIYKKLV